MGDETTDDATEMRAIRAEVALDAERAAHAETARELADMRRSYDKLKGERNTLTVRVAGLRADVDALRTRLADAEAQLQAMREQPGPVITADGVVGTAIEKLADARKDVQNLYRDLQLCADQRDAARREADELRAALTRSETYRAEDATRAHDRADELRQRADAAEAALAVVDHQWSRLHGAKLTIAEQADAMKRIREALAAARGGR